MGATLSVEQDSRYEEDDEELYLGQHEVLEDSDEDKLTQTSEQISSHSAKTESQTDEINSQSSERDLIDGGSGFVTLEEDNSETTDNPQEEDFSRTSTDTISKQLNNTDDIKANEVPEANNEVNENEIGFKKIFRFGGFKFTLKKDMVEKNGADKPIRNGQDRNASGSSEDSWDTVDVNPVSTNEQEAEEIKNERIGGGASADSHETHYEEKVGKISGHREEATPDKGMMEDVSEFEEPMSPLKRFFSQGMLGSLRKKKKEDEKPKGSEEKLKSLNKMVDRETMKEDTTCTCLEISNGTFDKDIQLYNKDESKPTAGGDIMNSIEQDKVQASPFKRLFRKLSTRRKSETKPGDTNLLEPGENITENPQLSTDLITSQKEQETSLVKTQSADEMMDTSHEESKKKSDSTVSWENLICVRSAKSRARKTSDSEDETHDKGEVLKRTTESPFESSTEGDHLTSSNEQSGNPAEDDSGSTWKSFKKMVTPKRKSRMEESSSVEQMQSDTEVSKDESSCSLRKLISGRKKIKPDGQQENMSSDEGSKGTVTDIEDDETPSVVPLSEYEIAKPEILNLTTDGTTECKEEKEVQLINEEVEPKQMPHLYNVQPLCFDAGPSGLPIPTEYIEELTEFLSKHQQLSDIPEEGIIEESVATPLSFVEWRPQDDTLADDIVDMTADAVTAPEHASENTEDETTEMVSALSQLSESPKTSGNVTPMSPVRESDAIFQEVVESFNMVPRVLSGTTNNEVPEALAVSLSKFIVESSTTTETKLLVTHKKDDATSVCIGIVSQEIRAAEVVLPLPLFEGISETTCAVPTEFASEELARESEAAGVAPDNVYEAKIKEIKSMLHEVLLLDEQSTILAETARKSKQHFVMVKNIQEEASPVVHMEVVDSTELSNGIRELSPVPAAVHGGTEYEEQNFTMDINRPEIESSFQPVLEEPVCEQLIESTKIAFEDEKQYRLPDVESSADDVKQCGLVAVAGPVAVSVVESVLDSSLNEVSKIFTEDKHFQANEVGKSVVHDVADPESDAMIAMSQASEITEDMTGVFALNVRCSETTAPINNANPISDSLNTEMDLKKYIQMNNEPSQHSVDSPIIRVKVTKTESQTAKENAVISLPLGTTLDASDVLKNIEMDGEEKKAEQKLERTAAETIEEVVDEKIVCTFGARNFSEIVDKQAKKRECKESELRAFVRERTLPIATTNGENANKEPQDVPKVMLGLETNTPLVEDCKRKLTAGDEICMLTLNTTETEEETKKPPATSEQPRVNEKVAESGIQPPASDILKQVSQATFSKVIQDTQTTAVSPESIKEKSAKIEAFKRPRVDNESDKLLADEHEYYYETASPEVYPGEPQKVISPSKSEKLQATELKFTLPVPNLQCLNSLDRVGSLEEVKRQCVDDQSVLYGTLLAEKQEPNETAKSEVNTEVTTEHQDAIQTVKTFPKAEPQLNTNKQLLSLQPGQSQPSESCLQPCEESSQITEVTEVECKISDQTVETRGVPVITTGYVTEILFKDKADPEGFVISKPEGSANVMDVIEANCYKVSVEVPSEHEAAMTVGSEKNRVSPDLTEQDIVSETDIVNIAGAETQEGKDHLHEYQTVVIESPIVPENKTEILIQMINEFKAESIEFEASESKADRSEVQADTSVVGSLVKTIGEEKPVVTLTEKSVTLKALGFTSVINTFQSDLKSVNEPADSTGITLQETPTGVSGTQTATRLSLVQTAALSPILKEVSINKSANIKRPVIAEATEPKLEMLMAKEAKSYTSAVSAVEVQTIETSASETETLVGTCVEKKVDAQGSVVTSIKEDTDMGSSVLTTMDSETKLETVMPVGQTLAELTITDVQAIQKPTLPVAPEVQTQAMVQAEVIRSTVIPKVEILAVNSTGKDVEIPFTGPEFKERHCDAQTAVKTEFKQPTITEIEVKVTKMIEHVRQDVEKTTNIKEDTKSHEEMRGRLKEFSVESRPGPDDVWEDALDDFIDDQCSRTEASGSAQDTTMCHEDK